MALHLEILEIRLARKANRRVQHLSHGPYPLAGFEVTPESESRGIYSVVLLTAKTEIQVKV
jgi:hypothetical protein